MVNALKLARLAAFRIVPKIAQNVYSAVKNTS